MLTSAMVLIIGLNLFLSVKVSLLWIPLLVGHIIFRSNKWQRHYALFDFQMSLVISKLVFNTFIPKEDHL